MMQKVQSLPKCGLAFKTCYETRWQCEQAIREVEAKRDVKLETYNCHQCCSWHMTKQKGMK
jgi:hypothetical protein